MTTQNSSTQPVSISADHSQFYDLEKNDVAAGSNKPGTEIHPDYDSMRDKEEYEHSVKFDNTRSEAPLSKLGSPLNKEPKDYIGDKKV